MMDKIFESKDKQIVPFLFTQTDVEFVGTRTENNNIFFQFYPYKRCLHRVHLFVSRKAPLVQLKDILEGVEHIYKELREARLTAAKKIQSHLMELGTKLQEGASVRITYKENWMDRLDLVFDPKNSSLSMEAWQTQELAEDIPAYNRNTYGSNIELERIDEPILLDSHPLTIEEQTGIWIASGRKLSTAMQEQIASQTTQ